MVQNPDALQNESIVYCLFLSDIIISSLLVFPTTLFPGYMIGALVAGGEISGIIGLIACTIR